MSELDFNALTLPYQFNIEEGTFQPFLESLLNDHSTLHHFQTSSIAQDIVKKCLLRTMKDELCLICSFNLHKWGAETTYLATLNLNKVILMLIAAVPTSPRTLSALTSLNDWLIRTSNQGFDDEEEQHYDTA